MKAARSEASDRPASAGNDFFPLFFIHGVTQYQGLFPPFLISVVAFSLVTTALYLRSGSVIPCILAHAWFNAFLGLGFFYGTHQAAAYADGLIRLAVGIAFFLIVAGKKEKFAHNIV
jgi:membrane protease YdiL (CAAX protease family)